MRQATLFIVSLFFASWAHASAGVIVLHASYGTPERVVVNGRILEASQTRAPDAQRDRFTNFVDTLRVFDTNEIEGAVVAIALGNQRQRATTDADGLFSATLDMSAAPLGFGWHTYTVSLVVDKGHPASSATGRALVIAGTGVAVISDFDDTVVESRVTAKGELLVRTFTRNAHQLEPVPGVGEAYRAMAAAGAAAFFYVSGSPQNLYQRIIDYLEFQNLPPGVVLLKNFGQDGLSEQHAYKTRRIEALLAQFPALQFVLVGDTGEQDPEIYRDIAERRRERVRAIVIRRAMGGDETPARLKGMVVVSDYREQAQRLAELVQPLSSGATR